MNKTDAKSLCCTEFDDDHKHDPVIFYSDHEMAALSFPYSIVAAQLLGTVHHNKNHWCSVTIQFVSA